MAVRGSTEIKVGIFVLAGILALFYLTFKLAEEAFTPKDVYRLYAVFNNVSGLTKGAKVEMAGIPIGRVGNIELTSNGKARVELLIYKNYKIQKDAKAVIRTYGVLGDRFVDIKPGNSSVYLKPGSRIVYTQGAISVDDILADIGSTVEELKDFLGSKEGIQSLKILMKNIKDASQSLKDITEKLEKGQGTLGKLITDDTLYRNLAEATQSLKIIAKQIEKGQGTLGKLIKDDELYYRLNNTVANLESISQSLKKGEGTLGKLMKDEELYKDLKTISQDLRKIIAQIESGNGTLGKLIKDESLYLEAKKAIKSVNRAAKVVEEEVPITILGTVAGSAMQ